MSLRSRVPFRQSSTARVTALRPASSRRALECAAVSSRIRTGPPAVSAHARAAPRRFRRVEFSFGVELPGEPGSWTTVEALEVKGDVSEGGAMFLLDRKLDAKTVDIVVKGSTARAEVLSASKKGHYFAHHCRFLDSA